MSDAPERIWAARAKISQETMWWPDSYAGGTEYIRADIHEAEVARLREALEGIWRCATAQNATDDEARGWIEVEARATLAHDQPTHDKRHNDQGADQE